MTVHVGFTEVGTSCHVHILSSSHEVIYCHTCIQCMHIPPATLLLVSFTLPPHITSTGVLLAPPRIRFRRRPAGPLPSLISRAASRHACGPASSKGPLPSSRPLSSRTSSPSCHWGLINGAFIVPPLSDFCWGWYLSVGPAVCRCVRGVISMYPLRLSWRGGSRARPASVEHVPCEQSYYVYATAEIDCLAQGPKYYLSSYNRL